MDDIVLGIDATQLPPRVAIARANSQDSPNLLPLFRSTDVLPACLSVPCLPPLEAQVDLHLAENYIRSFVEWSGNNRSWFQPQADWNVVRIGIAHPALLPDRAILKLCPLVAESMFQNQGMARRMPKLPLAAPLAMSIHQLHQHEALKSDAGALLTCSPGLGFKGRDGLTWWSHEWLSLQYERDAGQRGYRLFPQWFCSHVRDLANRDPVNAGEWERRLASLSPDVSIISSFDVALDSMNCPADSNFSRSLTHPDAVALGAASFARFNVSGCQENEEWKLMHPIPLPLGIVGLVEINEGLDAETQQSEKQKQQFVWRELPTTSTANTANAACVELSHVLIAAFHGMAVIDPPAPRWREVKTPDSSAECPWALCGLQSSADSRGISKVRHNVQFDRQQVSWSRQKIIVTRYAESIAPVAEEVRTG